LARRFFYPILSVLVPVLTWAQSPPPSQPVEAPRAAARPTSSETRSGVSEVSQTKDSQAQYSQTQELKIPDPEDGTVENGVYANPYFGLSYRLLPDWREDLRGPPPSDSGYYVLRAFRPKGEMNGTMMITAKDRFFPLQPLDGPMDVVKSARQTMSAENS